MSGARRHSGIHRILLRVKSDESPWKQAERRIKRRDEGEEECEGEIMLEEDH